MTFVLIDNSLERAGHSLLYEAPHAIIRADRPDEVADALQRLEDAVTGGGHAAGFLSYELGYLLEPTLAALLPEHRDVPLLWFGLFPPPRRLTPAKAAAWVEANAGDYRIAQAPLLDWTEAEYTARFDAAKAMIAAGDIYQLNLTFKARFRLEGSPVGLYRDLRRKQRVAYGGIIASDGFTVLSSSPELFIETEGDTIATRPMKGTAARAPTLAADEAARRELASDIKQRAENLMIVDLMRNDIGRIAEIGSVEVTDLFTAETYRTLHQLTSGIRARLLPGTTLGALVRAIFPPGSVTGAPKIRAMQLIRAYEAAPRGVYCGAIGCMAPGRRSRFNVAIRTVVIAPDGSAEMGIGSGLVADSVAAREYAECILKMRFLTDPPRDFALFETMLYDGASGFWLLPRHLERLRESAAYFDFPHDEERVRAALEERTADYGAKRMRVRLVLAEDGSVTVTATELAPVAAIQIEIRYALSTRCVQSSDRYLYHKTTRRDLYDGELTRLGSALGVDEVIFQNERGELTEGSRTNLFIARDGRLLTPPLASGLLPGTLRAELIDQGRAVEQVLRPGDLARGTVYLGNSVRGLMRGVLVEAAQSDQGATASDHA